MLVVDPSLLETVFIFILVDLLESIFEKAIILLKNSVFSGQLEWVPSSDGVLHASPGEGLYRFLCVEHSKIGALGFKLVNLVSHRLTAIIRSKHEFALSWLGHNIVLTHVLISKSMSTHNNWLDPSRNKSWYIFDYDRFSEHSAIQDISDCAVGRFPHFLKLELFDSCLIRSDGSTLDADFALFDSIGSINSDLVISSISVLDTKIIVLNIEV
jgi:hypothetical protein